MHPKEIQIADYTYELPDDRIAKYPLADRDQSKLLAYKAGEIHEDNYANLTDHLPEHALLILNNTRVIPARLFFRNSTGALIEIFCLEPADKNMEPSTAMTQTGSVRWQCMIGRASKWKEKVLTYQTDELLLEAEIISRTSDAFVVELRWQPAEWSFAEILERIGKMPIPPYLKRESEDSDATRYQTTYAMHDGSVAAPTAGLHFTPALFDALRSKGIQQSFVTLHVGAGTFKPVKSETMEDHTMHAEWMDVSRETLMQMIEAMQAGRPIISVGTTSLRTLESLYWMGTKAIQHPDSTLEDLEIKQWEAYDLKSTLSALDALQALVSWMNQNSLNRILCKTQILIAPPYRLKIASALITNFHQPASTLLLLIASIVGSDWKTIYQYAMDHEFRFLSYGDGSLLWGGDR
ncbi:MAG: S-adenosylmethionine:tRNA ribosyltransferase-isomerase [Chitinophagaceae bacterium]|nr:S-adenosylmethionine:tRNA ribosyltransferase-isomerase [Chitinophagaceae bacterium]